MMIRLSHVTRKRHRCVLAVMLLTVFAMKGCDSSGFDQDPPQILEKKTTVEVPDSEPIPSVAPNASDLIPCTPPVASKSLDLISGPLPIAPKATEGIIRNARNLPEPVQIAYPVGLVHREQDEYYVCNYYQLFLVNLEQQQAWEVPLPNDNDEEWYPVGLAYDSDKKELYVSMYTGGTVVVFDATEPKCLKLNRVISNPALHVATGIALSDDRQFLAVADYAGGGAMLFTTEGDLLWCRPVRGCHGIAFMRSTDDQLSICASSLEEVALYKYDLQGDLQRKIDSRSWTDRDSFMYPTSVISITGGAFAVTDAFRGQLCILDENISFLQALGGNGPGKCFFNNPYVCCENKSNQKILIADTYKDRLVEVDPRGEVITRIYQIANTDTNPDWSIPHRFVDANEVEALRHCSSHESKHLHEAFGSQYVAETDTFTCVRLPLPRFAEVIGLQSDHPWHPRVNGLNSATDRQVTLWCHGLFPFFSRSNFRFVLARNYEYQGCTYLLLTSPQSKDVLVSGRGVTVPVPLSKDTWLSEDDLIGPDSVIPALKIVELGAGWINEYLTQVSAEEPPLDTIRKVFFPEVAKEDFEDQLWESMPHSKRFAHDCLEATTAEEQWAAAERFLEACKTDSVIHLSEVMIAEMMLASKTKNLDWFSSSENDVQLNTRLSRSLPSIRDTAPH